MKEFSTAQIRNVALVAHHGVGKTSLAEAMLFIAKTTNRIGRIGDGTTMLDYAADEVQRQITINLSLAQFEWSGHKINLLDTPGFPDFVGDVHSALRVADAALLILRANTGVEVGTEVVWEILKHERTPVLLVVNIPASIMVKVFDARFVAYMFAATVVLLFTSRRFFRYALKKYRSASS